jgi:hypothetical protein
MMRHAVSFLALLLVALTWSPGARAQLSPDGSSAVFDAPTLSPPQWIEGKVADVDRVTTTVTIVRLEDGTHLAVPRSSPVAGSEVRAGTSIGARYVETMSGKVAVLLRVEPEVQAP